MGELLDDDVWAFSNCRVDAPGRPVAEVDWLFYNVRHGTIMVSEWKGFPQRVLYATDTGTPWVLEDGLQVPNPVEQVSRQLDAVRAVLRSMVLPLHFPAFDPQQLRIMQSVYSPQVDERTAIERIRWGKVYGSLSDLATAVTSWKSPSPLLLPDGGAGFELAKAFCTLFRTNFSAEVRDKLRLHTKTGDPDVVRRISEIHREMAALHGELADLMVLVAAGGTAPPCVDPASIRPAVQPALQPAVQPPESEAVQPQAVTKTVPAAAKKAKPQVAAVAVTAAIASQTEQQRMQDHLARTFKGVNGNRDDAAKALEKAWRAVLNDPLLHGDAGISVPLFGSLGTPLVKQHHGSLQKVLGMQLRKWCVLQAGAVGMKPRDVPGKPSNIRVR